jgi:DNA replication protein DnaC
MKCPEQMSNSIKSIEATLQKMLDNFYSRPKEEQEKIIQEYEESKKQEDICTMPGQPLPKLPKRLMNFKSKQSRSKQWSVTHESIKQSLFGGGTFVVLGRRGTGKSQMAVCLIKYSCWSGRVSLYVEYPEIFLRIRQSMDTDGLSELTAIDEFVHPYFLVIDCFELRKTNSEYENRTFDLIMEKRHKNMRATIIISNDKREEFLKQLGKSIEDRMHDDGGLFELTGKSFRRK